MDGSVVSGLRKGKTCPLCFVLCTLFFNAKDKEQSTKNEAQSIIYARNHSCAARVCVELQELASGSCSALFDEQSGRGRSREARSANRLRRRRKSCSQLELF